MKRDVESQAPEQVDDTSTVQMAHGTKSGDTPPAPPKPRLPEGKKACSPPSDIESQVDEVELFLGPPPPHPHPHFSSRAPWLRAGAASRSPSLDSALRHLQP